MTWKKLGIEVEVTGRGRTKHISLVHNANVMVVHVLCSLASMPPIGRNNDVILV